MAAGNFAVAATNVTMPRSGAGSTQLTVTAVPLPGYLTVSCIYAGANPMAKVPRCGGGTAVMIPVIAGQTVTATEQLYPYGSIIPVDLQTAPRGRSRAPAAPLALAAGLLLGFGLRRGGLRWLSLAVLAVAGLAGMAALSACSGSMNSMTPGTYAYTVSVVNYPSNGSGVAVQATTTMMVTVP